MAIYCYQCKKQRDWPGNFRVIQEGPCQFCGAKVPCYDFPNKLLPGMPEEINAVVEREEGNR